MDANFVLDACTDIPIRYSVFYIKGYDQNEMQRIVVFLKLKMSFVDLSMHKLPFVNIIF